MFVLNRPALITAGQILNQQCHAAAVEAVNLSTAPINKPKDSPGVQALITAAIADLAAASASTSEQRVVYVSHAGSSRSQLADKLASAVANIFHLAATNDIDLGDAIAGNLADATAAAQ